MLPDELHKKYPHAVLITSGQSKTVFSITRNTVLKMYRSDRAYNREHLLYCLLEKQHRMRVLCPTQWHAGYCIQPLCATPTAWKQIPKHMRTLIFDNGLGQFGLRKTRSPCVLDWENINTLALPAHIQDHALQIVRETSHSKGRQ